LGIHENSLPTVDSSNIYNFEEIELSEHQPSARLLQIQKKKIHSQIGASPFSASGNPRVDWCSSSKVAGSESFVSRASDRIFFSGALCHSASSSLLEGLLDAPDSGLLHALLKLLV